MISHLDSWIASKLPPAPACEDAGSFALRIKEEQKRLLVDLIFTLKIKSSFYNRLLEGFEPSCINCLEDLAKLPFTSPGDLAEHYGEMATVSGRDIARIVTIPTSGTTGLPKRLLFTETDLALTVDFFEHGMKELVVPNDRVMILMNCNSPASIGNLLAKGLSRMNVTSLEYGLIADIQDAAHKAVAFKPDCIVGMPSQVRHLALYEPSIAPKKVLLSADYIPKSLINVIQNSWGCGVFSHYGMTETGLGGGVECSAHHGHHTRMLDILIEIINPVTLLPCNAGEYGEIVITTLSRKGMPLLRYRTGDRSKIIKEPCPCGSALFCLDRIEGRFENDIIGEGGVLSIHKLDEILFSYPAILDYKASLRDNKTLTLTIKSKTEIEQEAVIESVLNSLSMTLDIIIVTDNDCSHSEGVKRKINLIP